MGKKDDEVFRTEEMPPTNFNCTKNKYHDNIYSKNYYNVSDRVSIQELLLDNSKCLINNCDIGKVDDKVI